MKHMVTSTKINKKCICATQGLSVIQIWNNINKVDDGSFVYFGEMFL